MEITTISVKVNTGIGVGYGFEGHGAMEAQFGLEARLEPGEDLKTAYKRAYLALIDALHTADASGITNTSSLGTDRALEFAAWVEEWEGERRRELATRKADADRLAKEERQRKRARRMEEQAERYKEELAERQRIEEERLEKEQSEAEEKLRQIKELRRRYEGE